uniref:Poly(ADP-ribose) polymerase family member 8 n=1 Tax=Strigops habroptila TaxID=2489341 RepID=A0A672TS25_STRHB
MGMCSRQERIQKDIDVVIQKCKAEKDCLFADFRYSDSTFTFTYIGGSGSQMVPRNHSEKCFPTSLPCLLLLKRKTTSVFNSIYSGVE